jgi:hypothetical protein
VLGGPKETKLKELVAQAGGTGVKLRKKPLYETTLSKQQFLQLRLTPGLLPPFPERKLQRIFPDLEMKTIVDLVTFSEGDLLDQKGFGRKSLNILKEWLATRGAYLGMKLPAKVA